MHCVEFIRTIIFFTLSLIEAFLLRFYQPIEQIKYSHNKQNTKRCHKNWQRTRCLRLIVLLYLTLIWKWASNFRLAGCMRIYNFFFIIKIFKLLKKFLKVSVRQNSWQLLNLSGSTGWLSRSDHLSDYLLDHFTDLRLIYRPVRN